MSHLPTKSSLEPINIPVVSDHTNAALVLTRFMAFIPGNDEDVDELNALPWYDPLDRRLTTIFETIKSIGVHTYQGEPITTVAHSWHGTTSSWYLILAYNGYCHPDEIRLGTDLQIPDINDLAKSISQNKSRKGEVVIV